MPKFDDSGIILALTSDAVTNTNPLHLAIIEAYMLWPRDALARTRMVQSALVECAARNPEIAPIYWEVMRKSHPITKFRQEVTDDNLLLNGVVVGHILQGCLACKDRERDEITKEKIIKRVIEHIQKKKDGDGGLARISVKSVQNEIWPTYSCVAHLWAARLIGKDFCGQGNYFPCRPSYLPRLLADAEALRTLGETTKMRQSGSYILDSSDTFKLPADLGIEPSNLVVTDEFDASVFQQT